MVDRWLREKLTDPVNISHRDNGINFFMIAHVTERMCGATGSLYTAYQYLAKVLEVGYVPRIQYFSLIFSEVFDVVYRSFDIGYFSLVNLHFWLLRAIFRTSFA